MARRDPAGPWLRALGWERGLDGSLDLDQRCSLQPSPLLKPGVQNCLSPPYLEKWLSQCQRERAGTTAMSISGECFCRPRHRLGRAVPEADSPSTPPRFPSGSSHVPSELVQKSGFPPESGGPVGQR